MTTAAYGLTDVGRRREGNEDEFRFDAALGLYAVADGMGGHAAGEIASRLAVETVMDLVRHRKSAIPVLDAASAAEHLREAFDEANRRICDSIRRNEEQRGMGTTVVALLAANGRAVIGYVGDSRAYLLRGGRLHRLTSDHSWVNEQVQLGLLTDDAAQRHPMRNIVTRALGSRADVLVDIVEETMQPGDVFLLCSDGLNTMLDDDEIRDIMLRTMRDPETTCGELVEAANARGGEDNVTVITVAVS